MRRFGIRILLAGLVVGLVLAASVDSLWAQSGRTLASQWVMINGQRWAVYQVIRNGREEHLFRSPGGEVLTRREFLSRFPLVV
jgi:hypothetical protein